MGILADSNLRQVAGEARKKQVCAQTQRWRRFAFILKKKKNRKKRRVIQGRAVLRRSTASSPPGSVSRNRIQQQPTLARNITPLCACDDTLRKPAVEMESLRRCLRPRPAFLRGFHPEGSLLTFGVLETRCSDQVLQQEKRNFTQKYTPHRFFDARARGGFDPQSCIVLRNSEASNDLIQQLILTKAFSLDKRHSLSAEIQFNSTGTSNTVYPSALHML